jgi:hypothetical protein
VFPDQCLVIRDRWLVTSGIAERFRNSHESSGTDTIRLPTPGFFVSADSKGL